MAALLAAGADPNEPGKSRYGSGGVLPPLHAAIGEVEAFEAVGPYGPVTEGPIDAVVLLQRYGARIKGWDVDKEGQPALYVVLMKHIEAVRLLLAAERIRTSATTRAPHRSVSVHKRDYWKMARLLLHCGAGKTIDEAGGSAGMNSNT